MITDKGLSTFKDVGVTDLLYDRPDVPEDYHCTCEYCTGNFIGEIYHTPSDSYYTQATRNSYYLAEGDWGNAEKHICPGHWEGYRYAIQKFTEPGDWVFDPTVGSGTAIVEAINLGRNGVGIELEFSEITKHIVDLQYKRGIQPPMAGYNPYEVHSVGKIIEGDARDTDELLRKNDFTKECFDLIVNGTPYPVLGGNQSDAPERKTGEMIYYQHEKNVGILKGEKYWETVDQIYSACVEYLKPGGKFVTIIKDPTQKKKPYLLHKMITDHVLQNNPNMRYYGTFVHKHIPFTYFMRTYPKRFPEILIPLYQTGTVLEKVA